VELPSALSQEAAKALASEQSLARGPALSMTLIRSITGTANKDGRAKKIN
jgi:hypothetical protein